MPKQPDPKTHDRVWASAYSIRKVAARESEGFVHVTNPTDVSTGVKITAFDQDRVLHSGVVTDVLPSMRVFWIFDEQCGTRKLIEFDEFVLFSHPPSKKRFTARKKNDEKPAK